MAQTMDGIRASVHSAAKVGWNGAINRVVERLRAEAAARSDEKERAAFVTASVLVEGMAK
ncbi:hypothetical protein [Terracoccus sp. 273MFTsu3.1]|uniref:hypothetical protein n=1 Tax=Terracoccus sp. 273MFTsu3.1 TaxID=1172188 RepID=UPI0012DF3CDC|nr:hypothetical protein [Terracoccus sp. 273MFTsu3.1]